MSDKDTIYGPGDDDYGRRPHKQIVKDLFDVKISKLEKKVVSLERILNLKNTPLHEHKCQCDVCKRYPHLNSLTEKGTPEEKAAMEWMRMCHMDGSDSLCMANMRNDELKEENRQLRENISNLRLKGKR